MKRTISAVALTALVAFPSFGVEGKATATPNKQSQSRAEKTYRIGISQCSDDIWRDKQNAEISTASYFHDNVELHFAKAYDSDERQVQQIDSLVSEGIDLLIVAPNQVQTISPAIDRAYDRGIPVIVFERKTNSKKYTAFISADNYEMGRIMGEHVAARMNGRGKVLEVMGLRGSSPAIERHKGFADALSRHPGISIVATLQGDWTEQSGYRAMKEYRGSVEDISFVFGQNDRMAVGARRAIIERMQTATPTPTDGHIPLFCGIDGLAGPDGGIRLVCDSILDATYIYPTHGDQLLALALDILEGRPYAKETNLMSALVTPGNARVLLMQNEEIAQQSAYLQRLHQKADDYLHRFSNQRTITYLLAGIIALLLVVAFLIYRYLRQRARIGREREQMARQQVDFYTQAAHQLRTPLTLIEGPLEQLSLSPAITQADGQTQEMLAVVRRNAAHLTEHVNKILSPQGAGSEERGAGSEDINDSRCEVRGTRYESTEQAQPSAPPSGQNLSSYLENNHPRSSNVEKDQTLLIVDDNADIRFYLRSILSQHYNVIEADDGQKGLETARAEVPDLIISDVMMPVMNGLEFCQHVKDDYVTSHIPVILLTARALSRHQVEGYRSGADAYLTKPFQPDLLLARIDNLLLGRQLLRNLWDKKESGVLSPLRSESVPSGRARGEELGAGGEELGVRSDESSVENERIEVKTPNSSLLTPNSSPSTLLFLDKFRQTVEERMADSDLSVEDLAAAMALSRVQLYRKVKAITGRTPVELLRQARLARARELLLEGSLTVSEVAYRVGFTAPSYFTKCFKEEFGILPTNLQQE